eukprot:gene13816-4044_t
MTVIVMYAVATRYNTPEDIMKILCQYLHDVVPERIRCIGRPIGAYDPTEGISEAPTTNSTGQPHSIFSRKPHDVGEAIGELKRTLNEMLVSKRMTLVELAKKMDHKPINTGQAAVYRVGAFAIKVFYDESDSQSEYSLLQACSICI